MVPIIHIVILIASIVNISCFGMAHDISPFSEGNVGFVPEDIDAPVGTLLATSSDLDSDEDEPYALSNNGNAGGAPEDISFTDIYENYVIEQPDQQEEDNEDIMDVDKENENWWITPQK